MPPKPTASSRKRNWDAANATHDDAAKAKRARGGPTQLMPLNDLQSQQNSIWQRRPQNMFTHTPQAHNQSTSTSSERSPLSNESFAQTTISGGSSVSVASASSTATVPRTSLQASAPAQASLTSPFQCTIYVLQCVEHKFYVGRVASVDQVDRRFQQHLGQQFGAIWTTMYRPIKIEETRSGTKYDEDNVVREYMEKYGIPNVRGGSFSNIVLHSAQEMQLRREIVSANDLCFKCGQEGHFATNCDQKRSPSKASQKTKTKAKGNFSQVSQRDELCQTCGRQGHSHTRCYARTTIDGDVIEEYDEEEEEDEAFEEEENEQTNKKLACYRCGRQSHLSPGCYAKFHVDGQVLR